jgi:tRNA dimethylallyltransferase
LKTLVGYKEFHNYLASPQRSDRTFSDAVENMKQSTRQYAKRQVSWIRNKLLPAVYAANASSGEEIEPVTPAYLLDATGQLMAFVALQEFNTVSDLELGDKWNKSVRDLGQEIAEGSSTHL